jgi:hypothetical protein
MGSPILSYSLPTGQVGNESLQFPIFVPGSKKDQNYQISFTIKATQQETLSN